jgi:hypothetical protein
LLLYFFGLWALWWLTHVLSQHDRIAQVWAKQTKNIGCQENCGYDWAEAMYEALFSQVVSLRRKPLVLFQLSRSWWRSKSHDALISRAFATVELHYPRETCFCVYSRDYPERSIHHEETQCSYQQQAQGAEPARFPAGVPASTAAAAKSTVRSTTATIQLAVQGPLRTMGNGNGQPCQTTGSCFLDAIAADCVQTAGTKSWTNGPSIPSLSSSKSCGARYFTSS